VKILIVDDHALLCDSLMLLLKERHGDALSLLQAGSGKEALEIVAQYPDLDMILLDLTLPDMHGFQVLQQLTATAPDIKVVALSGTIAPQFIQQCLALGFVGFIPKTTTGKAMLAAIDLILSGGTYIPAEAMPALGSGEFPNILTSRQFDVLRLIRQGMSNDEIASVLDISLSTVKTHVRCILTTLGAKNRTEAVNEAVLQKLL